MIDKGTSLKRRKRLDRVPKLSFKLPSEAKSVSHDENLNIWNDEIVCVCVILVSVNVIVIVTSIIMNQ